MNIRLVRCRLNMNFENCVIRILQKKCRDLKFSDKLHNKHIHIKVQGDLKLKLYSKRGVRID